MKLNPYLIFDGNCEEAFNYYVAQLGAKVVDLMRVGDAPIDCGDEVPKNQVMHAMIAIGDAVLMGSDAMAQCPYEKAQGISVALHVDSVAEAERVFAALADGGTVTMALEPTFWAARFGTVTDRFGTPWMINCEKEQ